MQGELRVLEPTAQDLDTCRNRDARPTRLEFVGLLAVPAVLWVVAWIVIADTDAVALDFDRAYREAARAIAGGDDPYVALDADAVRRGYAFVYPPLAGLLLAPFAALPATAGGIVLTPVLAACTVATLRLLEVTDWRCYAALLWWEPVLIGLQTANLSIPLALGAAALWRLRATPVAAPVLAAVMVGAKLFVWPVMVWLALTRGLRAFLLAVAACAGLTLLAWLLPGLGTVDHFLDLSRRISDLEDEQAFTVFALLRDLAVAETPARVVTWALGGAILGAGTRAARGGEDDRAYAAALVAALVLSPVVWTHYFALLIVPLALLRPRFGPVWLLPALLWVAPVTDPSPGVRAFVLVVAGVVVARCIARPARTALEAA